jgi:hypothetical protein
VRVAVGTSSCSNSFPGPSCVSATPRLKRDIVSGGEFSLNHRKCRREKDIFGTYIPEFESSHSSQAGLHGCVAVLTSMGT